MTARMWSMNAKFPGLTIAARAEVYKITAEASGKPPLWTKQEIRGSIRRKQEGVNTQVESYTK